MFKPTLIRAIALAICLAMTLPVLLSPSKARGESWTEEERLEALAKRYANKAANDVMEGIGGGQDLRVEITNVSFNRYEKKFEIKMEIYFNGSFKRSNQYNVDGVLTVNEDGSDATFARSYANENFKKAEVRRNWLAGAAIVGATVYVISKEKQEREATK